MVTNFESGEVYAYIVKNFELIREWRPYLILRFKVSWMSEFIDLW